MSCINAPGTQGACIYPLYDSVLDEYIWTDVEVDPTSGNVVCINNMRANTIIPFLTIEECMAKHVKLLPRASECNCVYTPGGFVVQRAVLAGEILNAYCDVHYDDSWTRQHVERVFESFHSCRGSDDAFFTSDCVENDSNDDVDGMKYSVDVGSVDSDSDISE